MQKGSLCACVRACVCMYFGFGFHAGLMCLVWLVADQE